MGTMFIGVTEAAEILGTSEFYAYKLIQTLQDCNVKTAKHRHLRCCGVEMRGDYFENGSNTGKLICGAYEISCAWNRRLSAENQKRIRAKI